MRLLGEGERSELGWGRGGAAVGVGRAVVEAEGEVAEVAGEGQEVEAVAAVERAVAAETIELGHRWDEGQRENSADVR